MKDKRKLKRRELVYHLKLDDVETGEVIGRVVDIHAEGLKISGNTKFDVGQRLECSLELPKEIFGRQKIRFSAQVLWCKPDINPDLTATGMLFVTIAAEDLECLIGLMAYYSFGD